MQCSTHSVEYVSCRSQDTGTCSAWLVAHMQAEIILFDAHTSEKKSSAWHIKSVSVITWCFQNLITEYSNWNVNKYLKWWFFKTRHTMLRQMWFTGFQNCHHMAQEYFAAALWLNIASKCCITNIKQLSYVSDLTDAEHSSDMSNPIFVYHDRLGVLITTNFNMSLY
jgi:hypothetical protein